MSNDLSSAQTTYVTTYRRISSVYTVAGISLVFIVAWLATAQSASADKLLRWKLQPGQSLQLNFQQQTDMTTSLGGTDMRSSANVGMSIQWDVADVSSDGTARIGQSIRRLTMKMNIPGNPQVEFDSARTDQAEGLAKHLAATINPLIGLSFVQQMTNRGEITDVDMSEESQKSLRSSAAGEQLQKLFSNDGLQALLGQAATVLPHHPVKPGDRWKGTSEFNSPAGKLVMDTTYTYVGTENHDGRPLERIDVRIVVDFGDGADALGLNVEVSKQNNHGTIFFDEQLGQFVSSDIVQQMTMETKLGEQVHRQQLNTRLQMDVTEPPIVAARPATGQSSQR